MSTWAVMWRRARRLALRSPGRTMATGSLVALSVAVVVVLAGLPWVNGNLYTLGGGASDADAAYEVLMEQAPIGAPGEVARQIVEAQPAGSSTAIIERFRGIRSAGRSSSDEPATVAQADWSSPLVADTVEIIEGRLPGPGEVVISPRIATREGLEVGDTLELADPRATLEVVGVGSRDRASTPELFTSEGEFVGSGNPRLDPYSAGLWGVTVLTDSPDGQRAPEVRIQDPDSPAQQVQRPVTSQEVDVGEPRWRTEPSALVALAGVLGVAIALTSGAAFGIGASRRRRAAGLLAANGADVAAMRIAAVTEALAVAVPAALVGGILPVVASKAWVVSRAPRWDIAVTLQFEPLLVVLACAFVVVAATLGTLVFTRSLRRGSIPALLDQRAWRRGRPVELRSYMPTIVVVCLLVLVVLGSLWSNNVGIVPAFSRIPVTAVVVGAFALLVWLAMVVARRLLSRRVSGRIIMRDVMRRPIGAAAAAVIVAIWSAVMVGSAAQARYEEVAEPESTSSYGIVGNGPGPVFGPGGAVPTTSVFEVPSLAEDVPDAVVEQAVGGTTIWSDRPSGVFQRGSEPEPAVSPEDLQERLAAVGFPTVRAELGSWTGPCAVCPESYIPRVAVLSSTDGAGQAPEVQRLLEDGYVLTPINVGIGPGAELAGIPLAIAPVDVPGAVGVVLASETSELPEDAQLTDPTTVLVGSTRRVGDESLEAAAGVITEEGVAVDSSDLSLMQLVDGDGSFQQGATDVAPLQTWALWLVPLLLVTLGATAAHRREHGEAARVLGVLGAGSRTARRLASGTAALIAGTGVTVGVGVGLLGVIAAIGGSSEAALIDVLWSAEFLGACALAVVVPVIVGAVAWLLPPSRQPGPGALAPA